MAKGGKVDGKASAVRVVALALVDPSPNQVRFEYDQAGILELAESIRQVGLLHPLVVVERQGRYEVVAGNRRYQACKAAGLAEVPVNVVAGVTGDMVLLATTENVMRQDMNPVEEGVAFARWMEETVHGADALATRLGRDVSYVHKRLSLLQCDEETLGAVVRGSLTLHHALELKRVEDPSTRSYLLNTAVKNGASVAILRGWVDQYRREGSESAGPDLGRAGPRDGSPVPVPRMGCTFCGRSAEEVMLKAQFICLECDRALRSAGAGVGTKTGA